MLADRRRKQKWSDDPNGLRWAQDSSAFGRKMLEKMGWQGGGLGKQEDGKQEFIRISVKNDAHGVGCVQKSDREHLVEVAGGLDDVLSALRGTSGDTSTQEKPSFSLTEASKERGTRFHYRKMVAAKDVAHRLDQVIITKDKSKAPQNSESVKLTKDYFNTKFKSGGITEGTFATPPSSDEQDSEPSPTKLKKLKKDEAVSIEDNEQDEEAVNDDAGADLKLKKKKKKHLLELTEPESTLPVEPDDNGTEFGEKKKKKKRNKEVESQ